MFDKARMLLPVSQWVRLFMGLAVYCCMLLLLATLGMIAVAHLPNEAISSNIRASVRQLQERGDAPQWLNLPLMRIDTFTDMIMLNVAYSMDEANPVDAAMNCRFLTNDDMDVFATTPILADAALDSPGVDDSAFFLGYGRYWHGYLLLLRPLLTMTTYNGLLLLNFVCLCCLFVAALVLVGKRCSALMAVLLLLSLLLVGLPVVSCCLQFSTCFHLMFIGVIAVLLCPPAMRWVAYVFFTLGALTSFFDLLTTPLLTLGIPLAVFLSAHQAQASLRRVCFLSFCWMAGYALLWLGKLPIAWWLTGESLIDDFMSNALGRSSVGMLTLLRLVTEKLGAGAVPLVVVSMVAGAAGVLFCCFWYWRKMQKRTFAPNRRYWLLGIGLLVPCWYLLMLQHSIIHYWFTWRALAVPVFCLFLFYADTRRGDTLVAYE